MKAAQAIFIALFGAGLTGCGSEQTVAQQRLKEADRQYQAATADCRKQFPIDEPKTIAAKMQCVNSSFALFIMPVMGANADLGQQWMAAQTNMAEQIQAGKMTVAQARDTLTQRWSLILSEVQRRNALAQTAAAQQSAAKADEAAAEWEEFGQRLAAANAAYAAGLAQSPPVQVQPMPPVRQQTFCNELGNTITCNGPGGQTFCNRIGNTITCQ
jgi:hypothetical protein